MWGGKNSTMKARQIRLLVIAGVVALAAAIAVSQTVKRAHMHGGGMFGEHALQFFTDYLDLTDAQQAQAKEILAKEKPTLQPLIQQMGESHRQLRQLEMSGTFDEGKVRDLAARQAQTMTELIVQKARIHSELVQILTPDQKFKLNRFLDRHERRFLKHAAPESPSE
jgi:Spy/CpxP family protein refolding chaperone